MRDIYETERGEPMVGDDLSARASAGHGATPLQVALRRKWSILAFAVAVTAVAAVVISQLPPRYTASAAVMINPRDVRVITAENLLSNETLDDTLLHTDMGVLQSVSMAKGVVEKLGLATNPELCAAFRPAPSWSARLRGLLARVVKPSAPAPVAVAAPCSIPVDQAAQFVLNAVSANNDGRSYIITIQGEAGSPGLAATIANGYADAFVADRREERRVVTDNATEWLTSYVTKLRGEVEAADGAIAQYRDAHHLTDVHGETVTSQSLTELNSQLSAVTSQIADKQSAVVQLQQLEHTKGGVLSSAAVLGAPLIQALMTKESDMSAALAQLSARFGEAYPQVVQNRAQLTQLRAQIQTEIARTVKSLSNEVATLQTRRAAITADVDRLQNKIGVQGEEDVRLAALVRDADSERQVYQSMLTRLKEIEVQNGIQETDARVLYEAVPPGAPTYPRKNMMIVGTFLASLGVGIGLAFTRNLLTRVFHDPLQVEEETGLRVLGLFPRPPRRLRPQDVIVDAPASVEAEAVYSILANLLSLHGERQEPLGRIILVTSALAGEGKTSFSVALGRAAMHAGLSTVLLDCDLRRSSVRLMLPDIWRETPPVSAGRKIGALDPGYTSGIDEKSGLPIVRLSEGMSNPHQLLASPRVRAAFKQLRTKYDVIVLDAPPLLPVADGLILAGLADDVALVVDWHTTPRRAVTTVVQMLRRRGASIAGAVLSKVDLDKFGKAHTDYHSYTRSYQSQDAAG